jgi:hypothetical protein
VRVADSTVTVSGGDSVEGFDIAGGTVAISYVDIIHCSNSNSFGGGIDNNGKLTLSNCTLSYDTSGGGLWAAACGRRHRAPARQR